MIESIIAKRPIILTVAAVAMIANFGLVTWSAFGVDQSLQTSIAWHVGFLVTGTFCFGAFAVWIFTEAFGPLARERSSLNRWLARIHFFPAAIVAIAAFLYLVLAIHATVK
jgi:hypothetical protein